MDLCDRQVFADRHKHLDLLLSFHRSGVASHSGPGGSAGLPVRSDMLRPPT